MVKTDKKKDVIKDYSALFATARGKRVLYDMMLKHWVMQPTFCNDPIETAYREGQRYVLLNIIEISKISPEKYLNQLEEAKNQNDNDRHI